MQGEKLELILKPRNSDEHYKCKMQIRKKTTYTNPWEKQEVALQLWDLTEFSENEQSNYATCMCMGSHFHIVKDPQQAS